jgi:hypothetical protein
MLRILAFAAALLVPTVALAQSPTAPNDPIKVMVLGVFHLNNPGRDINNILVDPVTTPAKQVELAAIAEALRAFDPTAVAIEREAPDPATLLDPHYPAFKPAHLLTDGDERVQIGYRLARLEGMDQVYAIDEKPAEGERDYFPFSKVQEWFTAHDRQAEFEALNAPVGAFTADFTARQRTETLGALLADINRRNHPINGSMALYYGLLQFGDAVAQPGAELNAAWYERNAKIFAKLMTVAKPGDRVVIIFGAGHAYWLRHFIENTPGYELVDPVPYLAGT